jgi:hypothetical protein
MAKKHKKSPALKPVATESWAAEVLTIGWLLAVMTAGLCEVGSMIALALRSTGAGMELAARYLFFAALVVGALSLLLAAAVCATRRAAPPRGILVASLAIGAAPLLILLLMEAAF